MSKIDLEQEIYNIIESYKDIFIYLCVEIPIRYICKLLQKEVN